jgi:hypothetical protein
VADRESTRQRSESERPRSDDTPLSLRGFVLYVSRIFAVPAALMAVAALLAGFAPTVAQSGQVVDVVLNSGRSSDSAPYTLIVRTPSGDVHVDVHRSLGEAVVTGDSAVVQTTRVSGLPRKVTIYREGDTFGSSSRARWFAWGGPLFLLVIAGFTLVSANEETPTRALLGGALFNIGGGVWGVVVALRALGF